MKSSSTRKANLLDTEGAALLYKQYNIAILPVNLYRHRMPTNEFRKQDTFFRKYEYVRVKANSPRMTVPGIIQKKLKKAMPYINTTQPIKYLGSLFYFSIAATPGSSFPSIASRRAPPPVEMYETLSARPNLFIQATESPPPIREKAPFDVASAIASATA